MSPCGMKSYSQSSVKTEPEHPIAAVHSRRVRLKAKSEPSAYSKLDKKKEEGVALKGSAVGKTQAPTIEWRCKHCCVKFGTSDDLIVHFGTSHQAEQFAHDKACFEAGSKRAAADVLKEGCASASEVATLVAFSKAKVPPSSRATEDATLCLFCEFVGESGIDVYRHMVVEHNDKAIPYRRLPFFLPKLYDLTRRGEANPVQDSEYDLWTCNICCYAARRKKDITLHISKTHQKPVVSAAAAVWKVRYDARSPGQETIAQLFAEDPTSLARKAGQTAITAFFSGGGQGGDSSSRRPPPAPLEPQVTARTLRRRKARRLRNIALMLPKPRAPFLTKKDTDGEVKKQAFKRLAKVSPRSVESPAAPADNIAKASAPPGDSAGVTPSASVAPPATPRVSLATPPAKRPRSIIAAADRRRRPAGTSNVARQKDMDLAALIGSPKGPPWVCQLCDLTFKTLASLRSHRSRSKAHEGLRPSAIAAAPEHFGGSPEAMMSLRTPISKRQLTDKVTSASPLRPKLESLDSPEPRDVDDYGFDQALGLAGL